jgi:chromate transporter
MLDLTLFLGKNVFFPSGNVAVRTLDTVSAGWVILSLVLLRKFKVNVIYLILLSVAFGVVRYAIVSDLR